MNVLDEEGENCLFVGGGTGDPNSVDCFEPLRGILQQRAFVSFGCGILLSPWLDQWTLPGTGFPLGFC